MEAVEGVLRSFVESPSRRGIALIVTLGLALAIIWPVADDYVAFRERRLDAAALLDDGTKMHRELPALRKQVAEEEATVGGLESHLVPEANVHPFRNALIDMALKTGCKVRQVEAGARTTHDFDRSERMRAAFSDAGKGMLEVKSPYALATQPVDLKLVGGLGNLEEFLTRLRKANGLIHTGRITFRPDRNNASLVELEMQIEVYDLVPVGRPDA